MLLQILRTLASLVPMAVGMVVATAAATAAQAMEPQQDTTSQGAAAGRCFETRGIRVIWRSLAGGDERFRPCGKLEFESSPRLSTPRPLKSTCC